METNFRRAQTKIIIEAFGLFTFLVFLNFLIQNNLLVNKELIFFPLTWICQNKEDNSEARMILVDLG